jgi:hypothetical protein
MDTPVATPMHRVPEILERARVEGWTDLAFIGRVASPREVAQRLVESGWHPEHMFSVHDKLLELPAEVASIHTLTRLAVTWSPLNRNPESLVGLGALTNLRILNLEGSDINDDGADFIARALMSLGRLTALDLSHTDIAGDRVAYRDGSVGT